MSRDHNRTSAPGSFRWVINPLFITYFVSQSLYDFHSQNQIFTTERIHRLLNYDKRGPRCYVTQFDSHSLEQDKCIRTDNFRYLQQVILVCYTPIVIGCDNY